MLGRPCRIGSAGRAAEKVVGAETQHAMSTKRSQGLLCPAHRKLAVPSCCALARTAALGKLLLTPCAASNGSLGPIAQYSMDGKGQLRAHRGRIAGAIPTDSGMFSVGVRRHLRILFLSAVKRATVAIHKKNLKILEEQMTYATVSNWTTTKWNDEHETIARDKFVPLIMSVGASRVQMIRTGEASFSVVTEYVDEATANVAQSKIAEIRAKAAEELPMSMSSSAAGGVFAAG